MTDTNWTPDEAYGVLRRSIEAFIASDAPTGSFYTWLTATFGTPPGTPSRHPVERLFKLAITDLVVYLQCDFERAVLIESLQECLALVESDAGAGLTQITRSSCFIELMKTRQIPAPLIDLTARNQRRAWVAEGFREI